MAKYVKLGDKAESFYDPFSELMLAGKQDVKELSSNALKSQRVNDALKGGHLSHASEAEFVKAGGIVGKKETTDDEPEIIESEFGSNAEELLKYYKDTYEVSKKDIEAFKKLSLQAMVKELTKLAE